MPNPNPKKENLKMWKKGQSGNPAGKPRRLLAQVRGLGYTKAEVMNLINTMLAFKVAELRKIAENQDSDMLERTIAKVLVKSFDKGSLYAIDNLLSRAQGKPAEMIDVQTKESRVIVVQYGESNNTIQPTPSTIESIEQSSEVSGSHVWQEVREIIDKPDNID